MKIYAYGFKIKNIDESIFDESCTLVVMSAGESYWSDGNENIALNSEQEAAIKSVVEPLYFAKYGVSIGTEIVTKAPSEIMAEIEADPKRDDIMFGLIVLNRTLKDVAPHISFFKTQ